MTRNTATRRSAAAAVETAVVLPLLFLLVCVMLAGGVGVFRHQQAACLAREGARWACVRGGDYPKYTDAPCPTRQEIVAAAVLPFAAGIDPADVAVTVQWIDRGSGAVVDWDAATKDVKSLTSNGEYVTNSVRVTVTVQWVPGVFWSPGSLRSVCEVPMSQ